LDNYNRLTAEINRATYHTDREFLLDQRHRGFVAAMLDQRDGRQRLVVHTTREEPILD
jgi:hypothetical protein